MRKITSILLAVLNITSAYCYATPLAPSAYPSGKDIYPYCDHLVVRDKKISENNQTELVDFYIRATYCMTAVATAFDTATSAREALMPSYEYTKCYRRHYGFNAMTAPIVLENTINYIRTHPEYMNAKLGFIMIVMLAEKYPLTKACARFHQ